MFHLGWFTNVMPPKSWRGNWGSNDGATWADGRFYIDFAQALERACFDYLMLEDSEFVPDILGGTMEVELKHSAHAPKHDPVLMVPLLAAHTSRLGIVATASTTFYPPYLLARSMAVLGHLTHGRVGWNIVTSSEDKAAQNFGMDRIWEHDNRYDRADEFVEVVEALWGSWEPEAVVLDRETRRYADHTKVHPIDHKGEYFDVRGPLNTLPPPGGRPVYCQAGGSPRGREFAARHADTIITSAGTKADAKQYRDDIRRRAEAYGRDPDDIKVLFLLTPIIGETEQDAQANLARRSQDVAWNAEDAFCHLAAVTEIDFAAYDMDAPVPDDLTTNGHQSTLADLIKNSTGRTLREAGAFWRLAPHDAVGTPDSVAELMGEFMDEVGGDGYLIAEFSEMGRRYIGEITDGLVPALQRAGLTRTSYEHTTLREHLLEF